jgi:quercetin dioxygenase-like cupin family protein
MQLARLADAPGYDDDHFVAEAFLEATHCNVRVIRLSPGQALPPHTHASSDLMLYVVEGSGQLGTADGDVSFVAGTTAHLRGDEQLRVANTGTTGMTLLAFLAPPFPPRADSAAGPSS